MRQLVQRALQGEAAHQEAWPPHRPRRGQVEVRESARVAQVRHAVHHLGHARAELDVAADHRAVRARVVLKRRHRAVGRRPDVEAVRHAGAVGADRVDLLTTPLDLDGPARHLGRERHQQRVEKGPAFGAEGAADELGDDPDVLRGQVERLGDDAAEHVHPARRVVQRQDILAAPLLPDGDAGEQFDGVVMVDRRLVRARQPDRRGPERRLHVSSPLLQRLGPGEYLRGRLVAGRVHVQLGRPRVVGHAHQGRGVAGLLEGLGHHHRDRLGAVVDGRVLQRLAHFAQPALAGELLAALRVRVGPQPGRVLVRHDGDHAGGGQGGARVDRADGPVRDGAVHDRAVGQIRDIPFRGVGRCPRDLEAAVRARQRLTDGREGRRIRHDVLLSAAFPPLGLSRSPSPWVIREGGHGRDVFRVALNDDAGAIATHQASEPPHRGERFRATVVDHCKRRMFIVLTKNVCRSHENGRGRPSDLYTPSAPIASLAWAMAAMMCG